jgi:hypothetical protein
MVLKKMKITTWLKWVKGPIPSPITLEIVCSHWHAVPRAFFVYSRSNHAKSTKICEFSLFIPGEVLRIHFAVFLSWNRVFTQIESDGDGPQLGGPRNLKSCTCFLFQTDTWTSQHIIKLHKRVFQYIDLPSHNTQLRFLTESSDLSAIVAFRRPARHGRPCFVKK